MRHIWIVGSVVISLLFLCSFATAESNVSSDNQTAWTGVWQSLKYYETLTQNGKDVSGPYVPFDSSANDIGVINGTISDNASEISGTWSESGDITLIPSDDYSTLDAIWAYDDQVEQFKKSDGKNGLDGTWNTTNLTLTLQLNGSSVSGVYRSLSATSNVGGYLNGTVSQDSRNVSGTFVESGNFMFALSEDGSYFNGTYSYGSDPVKVEDTWNAIRLS